VAVVILSIFKIYCLKRRADFVLSTGICQSFFRVVDEEVWTAPGISSENLLADPGGHSAGQIWRVSVGLKRDS
jgi:hypothetical protein